MEQDLTQLSAQELLIKQTELLTDIYDEMMRRKKEERRLRWWRILKAIVKYGLIIGAILYSAWWMNRTVESIKGAIPELPEFSEIPGVELFTGE